MMLQDELAPKLAPDGEGRAGNGRARRSRAGSSGHAPCVARALRLQYSGPPNGLASP
jgi:hypothetical protein